MDVIFDVPGHKFQEKTNESHSLALLFDRDSF